jgi:Death domain
MFSRHYFLKLVCEELCDMLGEDWRKLARNLSIMNEGHINEIQNNHSSDNQRTHQVSALFPFF